MFRLWCFLSVWDGCRPVSSIQTLGLLFQDITQEMTATQTRQQKMRKKRLIDGVTSYSARYLVYTRWRVKKSKAKICSVLQIFHLCFVATGVVLAPEESEAHILSSDFTTLDHNVHTSIIRRYICTIYAKQCAHWIHSSFYKHPHLLTSAHFLLFFTFALPYRKWSTAFGAICTDFSGIKARKRLCGSGPMVFSDAGEKVMAKRPEILRLCSHSYKVVHTVRKHLFSISVSS